MIKPHGPFALTRLCKSPTKIGSLFVPEQYDLCEAIVEAVGDNLNLSLKKNDRIIVNVHKGKRITHDKIDYVLYAKDEIDGVIIQ